MEANFDSIMSFVFQHEGGFVDNPDDPGGVTNLGVTLNVWSRWLKRPVTVDEMRALTSCCRDAVLRHQLLSHATLPRLTERDRSDCDGYLCQSRSS